MELRSQDKEIEMPKTRSLGYNNPPSRNFSSPQLSSSIAGERSDQQQSSIATTMFTNNPPHSSEHHNHHRHHHHPLQSESIQQQSQGTRRDPDPSSPPVATTTLTSTPVVRFTAQTTTTSTSSIRYRECLKNHAASMGCHVVDGCGEFMPCGEEGTPESLRCAACNCHRNFHRKEEGGVSGHYNYYPDKSNRQNRIPPHPHTFSHGLAVTSAPPVMMAFGGGLAVAESSSEDLDMLNGRGQISVRPALSKKRFRTKFTQQQKDRMMEFAEKLGWKIQKQDEQELQQFCSQVGVKRQVFKVWMHNNKQSTKKQQM